MSQFGEYLVGGVTGVGLMAPFMLMLRRQLARDRVEADLLKLATEERNDAKAEASTARVELEKALQDVARLTSDAEYLRRENMRQAADFAHYKRLVARFFPDAKKFVESDFQPLPPPPPGLPP